MHHFRFSQRTVAVVLGVVAVAYTVQAYLIPEFTAVEVSVQPGTLPRGLGILLIVLSAALFFQKQPQEEPQEPKAQEPQAEEATTEETVPGKGAFLGRFSDIRLEPLALLVAICLYVALFVPLGFVLSTTLFVVGTAWYLGFARLWVNVLVGGGVALSLYLVMSEGLDVALPTGPLPF